MKMNSDKNISKEDALVELNEIRKINKIYNQKRMGSIWLAVLGGVSTPLFLFSLIMQKTSEFWSDAFFPLLSTSLVIMLLQVYFIKGIKHRRKTSHTILEILLLMFFLFLFGLCRDLTDEGDPIAAYIPPAFFVVAYIGIGYFYNFFDVTYSENKS